MSKSPGGRRLAEMLYGADALKLKFERLLGKHTLKKVKVSPDGMDCFRLPHSDGLIQMFLLTFWHGLLQAPLMV